MKNFGGGSRPGGVGVRPGDGRLALDKIPLLKPTYYLDVEMPVMDGLGCAGPQVVSEIEVITFSALTRGAGWRRPWTPACLVGLDDVTKPSQTGSPAVAIERIRIEVVPKN